MISRVRCLSTITYGLIADSPVPVGTGGSAKTGPVVVYERYGRRSTGESDKLELSTDLPKGSESLVQVVSGVDR